MSGDAMSGGVRNDASGGGSGREVRRASLLVSGLMLVAAFAPLARGALPPGYGGTLRLPADGPLALPDPSRPTSPFDAMLARAVFDGLYTIGGSGQPEPELAAALPTPLPDGGLLVTLRAGIRRHDRRVLHAADVARTLRRAGRASPGWIAGLALDGEELDVRAASPTELVFGAPRLPEPARELARRLAAPALAIDLGRGLGTGPYTARLRAGALELRHFRNAARGAPFLEVIRVDPPRAREDELRAFELRQIDASWQGASLYGGPSDADLRAHVFPNDTAVLLVPSARLADATAALERALDRRRFERLGLRPSDRLAAGLPPPEHRGGAALPPRLQLLVREGDPFEAALGAALAARLDELGVRVDIARVSADRFAAQRRQADLSFAQVIPSLPGGDALTLAAWLATGVEPARAPSILAESHDPVVVATHARALPAVVLGHRARTLHHREAIRGASHDALGRLRLERLFSPRSRGDE
ncbi:MAG: hypothetical protein KF901_15815 [Myxococcales bacterium]|nr:hypothetical protein [Myxococcales bacterium]